MRKKPSPRRRRRGEGSITQRKNGSYVGYITINRERRYKSGATFDEVHEALTRLKMSHFDGGLSEPKKMTVSQHLGHWLKNVSAVKVAESTQRNRVGYAKNHILPEIGNVQIQKLNELHIQKMTSKILETGTDTAISCYTMLKQSLRPLVPRVIPFNPCDLVSRPRDPQRDMKTLDKEQADKFLQSVEENYLGPLFTVAILSGARSGELLALNWNAVDFNESAISIRKSLDCRGFKLNEPKSKKSKRRITLSSRAMDAFYEQKKMNLAAGNASSQIVFCRKRDGFYLGRSTLRYQLRKVLEAAGLPMIRFHDLRHTHATLLLASGANPKVIQERLGHSSIAMTLDTYGHVTPSMQQSAADKMTEMFG